MCWSVESLLADGSGILVEAFDRSDLLRGIFNSEDAFLVIGLTSLVAVSMCVAGSSTAGRPAALADGFRGCDGACTLVFWAAADVLFASSREVVLLGGVGVAMLRTCRDSIAAFLFSRRTSAGTV